MNALKTIVSALGHREIHLHYPFIEKVHTELERSLQPGGEIYTKYIKELRKISGCNNSFEMTEKIRDCFRGMHIKSIDFFPIHDRGQIGLMTSDGFHLRVVIVHSDGQEMIFD